MKMETTADIRSFLIEQMNKTAAGELEVGQAKSICNFAQQIYNTVKLEMQYASLKQKENIKKIDPVRWVQEKPIRNLRAA